MSPVHMEGGRIAFYVQAREGETGTDRSARQREWIDSPLPKPVVAVQPLPDTALAFGPFDLQAGSGSSKFHASRR